MLDSEPTAEEVRDEQRRQQLHQMNLDGARAQSDSMSMDGRDLACDPRERRVAAGDVQ